jgi:ATP-dependent Clp protease ATP-binding subunit ClpC
MYENYPKQLSWPNSNHTAMFELFTEEAIKVILLAQNEAHRLGHNYVGPEQILLGLIGARSGMSVKIFKSMRIKLKHARCEVEKTIGRGSGFVAVDVPFTANAKLLLEYSCDEAQRLRHDYVGTEHLLLGLIQESKASLENNSPGVATRVLQALNVDLVELEEKLFERLGMANPSRAIGEKYEPKSPPIDRNRDR